MQRLGLKLWCNSTKKTRFENFLEGSGCNVAPGVGGGDGGGRVGGEGSADPRRLRLPQRDAAQLHQPKVEGEPRPGNEVESELELLAHNIIKRRC